MIYFIAYLRMLLAATMATLAVLIPFKMAGAEVDFFWAMGIFLGVNAIIFKANPNMPLTIENVTIMSIERIVWSSATLSVVAPFYLLSLIV